MSEESAVLVRKLIEALGNGLYDDAAACLDPDAEWHNTGAFPGPSTLIGPDAIREFWRDLFGRFGADREGSGTEVERIAGTGEVMAVLVHGWGHGRGSDIPIDIRWAHTFRMRDSKVLRIDTFGEFARALEAAGLSE